MTYTKKALLTGVTDGIGKQVALGLAREGYNLVVIARNPSKFEALKREVHSINAAINIELYEADLSLVKSTQEVTKRIKSDMDTFDLIYQSAGLIPGGIELTQEQIEKTFAVSYLTRYVILKELLPLLLKSEDKLVLNMAGAGQNGKINFKDPNFQKTKFLAPRVVQHFQQANDALCINLNEQYKEEGLRIFCLMPGLVRTNIHKGWPQPFRFLVPKLIGAFIMVSPQKAAEIPLNIVNGSLQPESVLVGNKGQNLKLSNNLLDYAYRKKVMEMSDKLISMI